MADNMIELVARLDEAESERQIGEQLKTISNNLSNAQALKITCHISTADIKSLQAQISDISKGLTINPPTVSGDVGSKNITDNVVKEFNNAFGLIGKVGEASKKDFDEKTKSMLKEFKGAWEEAMRTGNSTAYDKAFENLEQRIREFNKGDIQQLKKNIEDIQRRFTDFSKVKIESNAYKELGDILGADTRKQYLAAVYGSKKAVSKGDYTRSDTLFNSNDEDYVESLIQAAQKILEYKEKIRSGGWGLDEAEKSAEDVLRVTEEIRDRVHEIVGIPKLPKEGDEFTIDVDDDIAEVKELTKTIERYDDVLKTAKADASGGLYPSVTNSGSTTEILESAKVALNEEFAKNAETVADKASRIKRAVEDTSGSLKRFYVQVEKGDKSVETLTYALNEQGTAYEYLGKVIREADNSTDFRRKGLDVQKKIQTENLTKFTAQVEKSGVASDALTVKIHELETALSEIKTTNEMNAFLDDFDIAKAKFQALKAQLQAVNAETKKQSFAETLNNKIKQLSANMDTYAASNKRAISSTKEFSEGRTFADVWDDLQSRMARSSELTADEVKHLGEEFRIFGKRARAAGLEGSSALEKFGKSFQLISTYISANQLFNMAISNIRSAVEELKTVDDRLTEISKTSDRTADSLKALGYASFDAASKYGRTASDYLLGVQEMSRAGFGEKQSEEMSRLSVLSQAAGDMTAELANQYLIATNAAYQYNGQIESLNEVLDRQNFVTNHYALSMTDLAEATKIAASQAAQSGIGIDEMTAALSTMISTTQQGGEIAARSLRGILMNIQQVKGEVGDGEDDITSESLSKYEKAAAALGVSLKEVRNGAVALRDPMVILDELATAFNKEADDSIKKANLISAIGGKYRGNQLSALLSNWDTYKEILETFNSDQAVGSAMAEAEKSANNWAGSLNKVKNSWAELVNQFINSENATTIIQSLDVMIQSLTGSATVGGLKIISDTLTSIIKLVATLSEKIGTIPTILAAITTINAIRGKGKLKNVPTYAPL